MPAISVIVPVYQAEALLPQCVESVLAQTFSDWELLLIDDGSRDGSPTLCDGYAARDPRIRVFHKPNGGLSDARNYGLCHAQGEYILFMDGDDWLAENVCPGLLQMADGEIFQRAIERARFRMGVNQQYFHNITSGVWRAAE